MSESDQRPDGLPISMLRPHLDDLPVHALPEGYRMHAMEPADVPRWLMVQRDAEPFNDTPETLFHDQFGDDAALIRQRCRLLEDDNGEAVGCISAWLSDDFLGAPAGRIHWVAIRPAWQGRGLAKGMLCEAMQLLARWHDRAWLSTQTRRLPAIRIYLGFGFEPVVRDDDDRAAWRQVADALPALAAFL